MKTFGRIALVPLVFPVLVATSVVGVVGAASSTGSVTFQRGSVTVGQVWQINSTTTQQMELSLSDGSDLVREISNDDTQQTDARIEILRVSDGQPERLHIRVRDAWTQEFGAEKIPHQTIGHSYIAQRSDGRPQLLRDDGKPPGMAEATMATRLSDDLLGKGAGSPEAALFEIVAGRTVQIGERLQLDDARAKLVLIGMPAGEMDQWTVENPQLTLTGSRDEPSGPCGVFEVSFSARHTQEARTIEMERVGEICVATEHGRWLRTSLRGPTKMSQPFFAEDPDLRMRGEGTASTESTWQLVGDTSKRRRSSL